MDVGGPTVLEANPPKTDLTHPSLEEKNRHLAAELEKSTQEVGLDPPSKFWA